MAKKRTAASDDITLYDIAPAFQDKLAAWLVKKPHGVIVDIGATPEAFKLTFDPGDPAVNASFEDALHDAMGSRSRTKYIDPELEAKIHEFLVAKNAHMTFGASKDGTFNVVLSNPDARGTGSDEDFEIALMLAEEEFWQNMPARPLPPGTRAALEHALKPRVQREEESHEALRRALLVPRPELDMDTGSAPVRARPKRPAKKPQGASPMPAAAATPLGPSPSWFIPKAVREEIREDESRAQLHKALMEPRAGLEANRQGYGEWAGGVESMLEARGYDFRDASVQYWRQLYQAGFGPHQAAEEFETAWLEQRGYAGNRRKLVANWDEPVQRHFGLSVGDVVLFHGVQRVRIKSMRRVPGGVAADVVAIDRVPGMALTEWTTATDNLQPVSGYEENAHRPPPAPSSKPFDPGAPREHYAKSHHFAVNAVRYMVLFDGRPLKHSFVSEDAADTWIEDHVDEVMVGCRGDDDSMRTQEEFVRERYSVAAEHPEESRRFEPNMDPNASGEYSKSGTYRVYSTSPFSGERAPHGHVWGVMGYGQGEGAYEGAAAQAEDMRQEGFKRVRNLGTMVEWLQPERMHLETNPGVGTYPRGRVERARTPHDVNVPEGGSWRIRLAGNDIVPIEYRHAADAERYARHKYGPSGWTVEWHAGAA